MQISFAERDENAVITSRVIELTGQRVSSSARSMLTMTRERQGN